MLLYADEDFAFPAVEELRVRGHDVLTAQVGLEPTPLARTGFESGASAISVALETGVAVAEHSHCVEVVHLIWEFYRYCRARIARRCRSRRDGTRRAESRHVSPEPHPPSNMEPDAPLTLETTARNHGPVVAAG